MDRRLINHKVRNTLQLIGSLMAIEKRAVGNDAVSEAYDRFRHRIAMIAGTLDAIDAAHGPDGTLTLRSAVPAVTRQALSATGCGHIPVEIGDLPAVTIKPEQAMTLSILVYELGSAARSAGAALKRVDIASGESDREISLRLEFDADLPAGGEDPVHLVVAERLIRAQSGTLDRRPGGSGREWDVRIRV